MIKNLFSLNDTKKTIYVLIMAFIISAIFGFIYETIFYRIDLGYFIKRGSTYGPWVPIYGFGSLFVLLLLYRFKNKPVLLFILSIVITGLLEYITGFTIYKLFNIRLWDYNVEMLNFGNIDGYICLRSLLTFGIFSLILVYIVVPIILKASNKLKNKFNIISISLGIIFVIDVILYMLKRINF